MKYLLFSTNNLLVSTIGLGALWLFLLFLFCFFGVHLAKLAKFGWAAQITPNEKKPESPQEPPPEKKAPTAPPQEPVYYIVERKKKRSKPTYGEPKEIRFK